MQTSFPEDARWNAERQAVEFGGEIGEYRGVVGFRAGCQAPAAGTAHSERCVEAYYLPRGDMCRLWLSRRHRCVRYLPSEGKPGPPLLGSATIVLGLGLLGTVVGTVRALVRGPDPSAGALSHLNILRGHFQRGRECHRRIGPSPIRAFDQRLRRLDL
jgi:hypothetical protein